MIKIRITADTLEEITDASEVFKRLFPTMLFTKPQLGNNPKYDLNPQFLVYGKPRVKNKKPRNPNFKTRLKNLKKK